MARAYPRMGPIPCTATGPHVPLLPSVVEQFEFLNAVWMGDPIAPRSPGGHDMVIGQNGQPGEDGVRTWALVTPERQGRVTATRDAVIPTGEGCFFSPSISALRDVLAV